MLKEVISKPLLRKHGVEIQFLRFTKLMTLFFVCVNCKFDLRALGEGHGDIKINNSGKMQQSFGKKKHNYMYLESARPF